MISTWNFKDFSYNFNSTYRKDQTSNKDFSSSLFHLRYKALWLICNVSHAAQYHYLAGLYQAVSCQEDLNAEFNFISRTVLISRTEIPDVLSADQGSTVWEVTELTKIHIPNHFSGFVQFLKLCESASALSQRNPSRYFQSHITGKSGSNLLSDLQDP